MIKHAFIDGVDCKPCSRCAAMLAINNYSRSKITSDGLRSACKECERKESRANYAKNRDRDIARARAWQAANPEKVRENDRSRNKEARNEWRRKWARENPDKVRAYSARNYEKLKARGFFKEYQKKWREEINRGKYLEWSRRNTSKARSTSKGVIDHRMNTALRIALGGGKDRRKWTDLVGYTRSELIEHLSKTMPDGYSWERIGELHIDHLKPRALFQYSTVNDQQFKECWALDNLQLLPAVENLSKGKKYNENRRIL